MSLHDDIHFLHNSSKLYETDLAFLRDEIKFLRSFLKTNYTPMFLDPHPNRIQLLYSKLAHLKGAQETSINKLSRHQNNLMQTASDLLSKSVDFLKLEGELVEGGVKDLNKSFRKLKSEIFAFHKSDIERKSEAKIGKLQFG